MKRKKSIPKLIVILIIIVGIALAVRGIQKNKEKFGYIKDGKVVFSNLLVNKGFDKSNGFAVIEISATNERLNNIIVSSDMLNRIKNGDELYSKKISELIGSEELSNSDLYNIPKAIELGIIKEDDSLLKYYSSAVGFKREKKFIEFCDKCFELVKIDSKGV